MYHMLTVDEFEKAWDDMVDTYGVRNYPYMTQLFEVLNKWAKP